jgi:hypothetical protein
MQLSYRFLARFVILLLAFSGFGLGAGFAAETVWVGLYLAKNGPPPPDALLAPEKLQRQLVAVFGFEHYELIKAQEVKLRNEWEQWFVPRRDLFLRLEPLRHQPDEPRIIDYEIYKDGFIVAKGKYEPREGTPLFINGPDFHAGRLIFVLDAR